MEVSYDEMFKICISNYIYCVDGTINNPKVAKTDYVVSTCFANSMILFYWLILNDKNPNALQAYRLKNHKDFKCPMLFVPLFENGKNIYYYPISLETKPNISKSFSGKKDNKKIVEIDCEKLEFEKVLYKYPIIKSAKDLEKFAENESMPLEKLAILLIQKMYTGKNTKEFNFARFFLGYALVILQNIYEKNFSEVEKQIKYLYFFMFLFFFDDISNVYGQELIDKFINEYLSIINICFSIEIDFNSNHTLQEIFLLIANKLKENPDEYNFFSAFQYLFAEAPHLFSNKESSDDNMREIHERFLYRFERSSEAFKKYKGIK